MVLARRPGQRRRRVLLDRAVEITAEGGRQAATIGALAGRLGMSKAGVFAHVGSKAALDLAIVETAAERLGRDVLGPAGLAPPGVARLAALVEGWLGEVAAGRPAPRVLTEPAPRGRADLRDRLRWWRESWHSTIAHHVTDAVRQGELVADTHAAQAAFEIDALLVAALRGVDAGDDGAPAAARRAVGSLLRRLATGG
jgi:AcrR family transcriptional regulator